MKYFKKVVGERVYLSPINPSDIEKYIEWINNPEVVINTGHISIRNILIKFDFIYGG
ncbi:hypothetical protein [Orenia metallireducens]|jgi:hypothetical protein|uniref:hypothetical protein n=1 Tax=Orenia metallireducens TaxID=1413210 RepID=UPI00159F0C7F|nr:hypothetical protein [Orenia metallireducens]